MIKLLLTTLLLFTSITSFATQKITAKSYLVVDEFGDIVVEKNADDLRSIASITKLMTAMVVLDAKLPLDELIYIDPTTRKIYNKSIPQRVSYLSRQEMLDLAVAKSDNMSAYLLCKHYPGGVENCITAMNVKAIMLGLVNTKFVDPTGLDSNNISTARELVRLVIEAQNYSEIVDASGKPYVDITISNSQQKFNNTNPLVHARNDVIVSKTGYIAAAGGCLVMLMETEFGRRVIVLLGSRNTKTRAPEALRIALVN